MAKTFFLQPCDAANWLSPHDVVARLEKVFDHIIADRETGRARGDRFVNSYRNLIEGGLGDKNAPPLEAVERMWRDAVVVHASDASGETAPFETTVTSGHRLELIFAPKSPFQKKRRSAEKAALALGYAVELFDPNE